MEWLFSQFEIAIFDGVIPSEAGFQAEGGISHKNGLARNTRADGHEES